VAAPGSAATSSTPISPLNGDAAFTACSAAAIAAPASSPLIASPPSPPSRRRPRRAAAGIVRSSSAPHPSRAPISAATQTAARTRRRSWSAGEACDARPTLYPIHRAPATGSGRAARA
jgi:hypothetical protein